MYEELLIAADDIEKVYIIDTHHQIGRLLNQETPTFSGVDVELATNSSDYRHLFLDL